jgi:hypothetical protein
MNSIRRVAACLGALACFAGLARAQSLSIALETSIDSRLELPVDPAPSMAVWRVRSDSDARYERNPDVWTGRRVDLTGKAVWNSCSHAFGTTAVSPRHVLYAQHVAGLYPVGTIVRFVTNANAVVERRVVASTRIGTSDIDLSTLDVSLPETIHWFRVMPERWFLRCSRRVAGTTGGIPCIVLDANTEGVAVADLDRFYVGAFSAQVPADPRRRLFTRTLRAGDSGSPMFLLLGDELVLDGMFSTAWSGPEFGAVIGELDAAMQAGGAQLTIADVTLFVAP